jgi:hypothetical protein
MLRGWENWEKSSVSAKSFFLGLLAGRHQFSQFSQRFSMLAAKNHARLRYYFFINNNEIMKIIKDAENNIVAVFTTTHSFSHP